MNKRIFPVFLLLILSLFSCKERDNIFIKGEIKNGAKKMLYLDYLHVNTTETLDSLKIKKDGTFSFGFFSENPGIYILRNSGGKIINLLPFPGEELTVLTNYENFDEAYTVTGSEESEYLRQLVSKLKDTRQRLKKLNEAYGSLSNVTEDQASEYITKRKEIIKDQRDFSIQFIIEHLTSLSSIYAIYQEITEGQYVLSENKDIQYMKIVADSISRIYPNVDLVKSFVNDARAAEERYFNLKGLSEKLSKAEVGMPEIKLPDTEGDSISLSSLKGKTVLVYFWSAMSEDARNLNPQLKQIYEENKDDGFEIYAIALDNSRNLWNRAIEYDELDWINVSELTYPESKAALVFNVNVIPSTFLLNREGEVVARDIYGKELQKWLDNML
ncbi:MAG: thioredoxin-like domain-containing protein [Bacteroidota bacterium]